MRAGVPNAARRPDVLVGRSTPATAALRLEAPDIPIIFVNVNEPIEQGFVQSLARPGGNITGFTNIDTSIGGKWLQLLKEIDPRIAWVATIYNPQDEAGGVNTTWKYGTGKAPSPAPPSTRAPPPGTSGNAGCGN
jgi:ABC-type uncharacterized transport system substrate-binding protein